MSLARNTLLYMPAQVIGPLAQFAATVAWTHYVAPSAFGIVTFVMSPSDCWAKSVIPTLAAGAPGTARAQRWSWL